MAARQPSSLKQKPGCSAEAPTGTGAQSLYAWYAWGVSPLFVRGAGDTRTDLKENTSQHDVWITSGLGDVKRPRDSEGGRGASVPEVFGVVTGRTALSAVDTQPEAIRIVRSLRGCKASRPLVLWNRDEPISYDSAVLVRSQNA